MLCRPNTTGSAPPRRVVVVHFWALRAEGRSSISKINCIVLFCFVSGCVFAVALYPYRHCYQDVTLRFMLSIREHSSPDIKQIIEKDTHRPTCVNQSIGSRPMSMNAGLLPVMIATRVSDGLKPGEQGPRINEETAEGNWDGNHVTPVQSQTIRFFQTTMLTLLDTGKTLTHAVEHVSVPEQLKTSLITIYQKSVAWLLLLLILLFLFAWGRAYMQSLMI